MAQNSPDLSWPQVLKLMGAFLLFPQQQTWTVGPNHQMCQSCYFWLSGDLEQRVALVHQQICEPLLLTEGKRQHNFKTLSSQILGQYLTYWLQTLEAHSQITYNDSTNFQWMVIHWILIQVVLLLFIQPPACSPIFKTKLPSEGTVHCMYVGQS